MMEYCLAPGEGIDLTRSANTENDAQENSTQMPFTGATLPLRHYTFLRFGSNPPQIL